MCIDGAIDSALAQTYEDFEPLIVGNCSSDGSLELAQARFGDDDRSGSKSTAGPSGAVGNHDRIRLARGELMKFLHQYDLLASACLARMVPSFEAHPGLGLAFCRREICWTTRRSRRGCLARFVRRALLGVGRRQLLRLWAGDFAFAPSGRIWRTAFGRLPAVDPLFPTASRSGAQV